MRNTSHVIRLLLPLTLATVGGCFPSVGDPGYFTVDAVEDSPDDVPGDGLCRARLGSGRTGCTLRAALMESNAAPDANTIRLPAGEYGLARPLFEGAPEDSGGGLLISGSVRIEGGDASSTVVSAATLARRPMVFFVTTGNVSISGITIRDGGWVSNQGGGIHVARDATLILDRVVITDNTSNAFGAGIWNAGTLTLVRSTVRGNTAGVGATGPPPPWGIGGGIFNDSTGVLTIRESTISSNAAGAEAGGIMNLGSLSISNSTVSGNTATGANGGGGLSNSASVGARGRATLASVTITDNRSGGGGAGGVHNFGSIQVDNTIIAGNVHTSGGVPDCGHSSSAPFESGGYNLIGDPIGCVFTGDATGHVTGVDPRLSSLADHGGPTATHRLLPGSPAIDAGHPTSCPATDQTGRSRPGRCDIGAFELVR